MELTARIASLTDERVLVVGSLPPHGRDLDLLVRPAAARAIAAGLARDGFAERSGMWARLGDCTAEVVELASASAWGLAPPELDELFAAARPIEPTGRVCRPAPHHAILILARRTMREGAHLRERRRERIADELRLDPQAFQTAGRSAPAWGATRSLALLERAHREGGRLRAPARRRAIGEELRRSRGALRAAIGAWRAILRRPRRGALIGLATHGMRDAHDYPGHLAATLERLGSETALIRAGQVGLPGDEARGARSPSLVATLRGAVTIGGAAWPALLRGEVVVCDWGSLDGAADTSPPGERRRVRRRLAILRMALPRPHAAYLVAAGPGTGRGKAAEGMVGAEDGGRRTAGCRELAAELGLGVVEATQPRAAVCAELAAGSWARLQAAPARPATQRQARLRARLRPRGLGVALLGPDGAGKSSVIGALRRDSPLPVRVIYMGLYQGAPRERRRSRLRPPGLGLAVTLVRQQARWVAGAYHRRRGRLVLFDRYTFDALLAPDRPLSTLGRLRRRLLARAAPPPDLTLILDAPAPLLFERKREYDVATLDRHRRGYLELAARVPRAIVIDAGGELEDSVRQALDATREAYARRAREAAGGADGAE